MTVRTWFTISAIVVIALFGAVALRLASPVVTPTITARSGDVRLLGSLVRSCWPDANGKPRCARAQGTSNHAITLPRKGSIRVIVAYPLQPKQGYIEVETASGHVVFKRPWTQTTAYDLAPGRYALRALAQYSKSSHLEYVFGFRVR